MRVGFHNVARESSTLQVLEVDVVPQDTVLGLKQKVAAAAGGAITADDLLLSFGPNDRHIGRQYVKDPAVDEGKLKLEQYSLLSWIQRFPHWTLSGKANLCVVPFGVPRLLLVQDCLAQPSHLR